MSKAFRIFNAAANGFLPKLGRSIDDRRKRAIGGGALADLVAEPGRAACLTVRFLALFRRCTLGTQRYVGGGRM